jgi:hypothetical protein
MSEDILEAIDKKLNALLALLAEGHAREHAGGRRQQRHRSLDRILTDAGLSAKEIATILGKTDRAVHLVLQSERTAGAKRR